MIRELKGHAIDKAFAEGENVVTANSGIDRDGYPINESYYVDDKPPGYWQINAWLEAEFDERCLEAQRAEWKRQAEFEATPAGKKWLMEQEIKREEREGE